MTPSELEHDVANAAMGVALEIKHVMKCLERIQGHLQRMRVACETAEGEEECTSADTSK